MDDGVKCRSFRLAKPEFVGDIIAMGVYGRLALLRDDPSRVYKFCAIDNSEGVEAIEQEKKILEILGHHDRITHLHWTDRRGLCFECYRSDTLRSYYKDLHPALPPFAQRILWCQQVIDGVAYIHSKNVVHNDISARNILLSSSMDIKICDFGFSRMIGEEVTGGPEIRYSRPRPGSQLEATVLDDIFSVGSLLYEILTGSLPYADTETIEVDRWFQAHVFPPTEDVRPMIFADIIEKCWNEKYQSISSIQDDLGAHHFS